MEDQLTITVVAAGTLAAFVFMGVQVKKVKQARHRQSLGHMYQPAPKHEPPPTAPE